jgi:predicted lysophospholipase L1 biosynthesis ABC-type transport system permease subunit
MLTQLNREFPTISLLDIGAILQQIGQVLSQVSRALEVMVILVTACGVLLLLAQVQVGMRQRYQELVVWRTLGAGSLCCVPRCGRVRAAGRGVRRGGGDWRGGSAGAAAKQNL